VLIELFSLGVTAEALQSEYRFKIGDFAPAGGSVDPKFQVEGSPHQPFFF